MNLQPIEKIEYRDDGLTVHSIFKTIQGEGIFTGQPSVFVRLAGCNLRCPSCDTVYTGEGVEFLNIEKITQTVKDLAGTADLVVITGGEPFRQNISPLVRLLVDLGYRVQIETNGTLQPSPEFPNEAYVIVSPKTTKINRDIEAIADGFKYVVSHDSIADDGLPVLALNHVASPAVARPPSKRIVPIFLQPMDAKDEHLNELNLKAAVDSCLANGYTLQIQVHKIIGVE